LTEKEDRDRGEGKQDPNSNGLEQQFPPHSSSQAQSDVFYH
jgi:hypothetical protein